MLFNSFAFLIFFPVVLLAYVMTRGRARLWLLVLSSYVFYGWWDWRFTALLFLSTTGDFWLAQAMWKQPDSGKRRGLLVLSLVINLGVLAFFKYTGFLLDSLATGFASLGIHVPRVAFHVALPVGISFYTFHSLSYTIDVYRREMEPEPSLLRYSAFVCMFPHLVAGPIVRAHDILPQLRVDQPVRASRFDSGLTLVVWGFFKKIVVADTLATVVDPRFANPVVHGSLSLLLGILFYSFQIYADFSGYSDIAIGTARILGFDFPKNFERPYFSTSFSEFWRRWHMSLSSWLRDYLYISLGGNRLGVTKTYRNLMITMLLGGLWHGASWSFVVWGCLHGVYLVSERALGGRWTQWATAIRCPEVVRRGLGVGTVYGLTCLAWVFFRAPGLGAALTVLTRLFTAGGWSPAVVDQKFIVGKGLLLVACLLAADGLTEAGVWRRVAERWPGARLLALATACWSIALFGSFHGSQFIYFQF